MGRAPCYSIVWIDGKNTTLHTPVVGFKLPCGKHKISFKRPDLDIDQTEIISLRPGTKFMQRYMLMNNDLIRTRRGRDRREAHA